MRAIVSLLLSFLIIAFIIYTILRPNIIKPILRKFATSGDYDPLPIAKRFPDYTLYSALTDNKLRNRDLIVIFIGGAFIIQSISSYYGVANQLYSAMSKTHDVMVVQYPVRFSHTIQESMISLNSTLAKEAIRYKSCHFVGFSAGALLASMIIRKEKDQQLAKTIQVPQIGLHISSMVSVCGLLYTIFNSDIVNRLFNYYILNKTQSAKSYQAQNLNMPTLLISCKNDILYNQTLKFAQTEQCKVKMFNNKLSHMFVQMINLKESKESVLEIISFIKNSTKTAK